jgi:hypothetical protein
VTGALPLAAAGAGRASRPAALLWYVAALLGCLAVLPLNGGGPLYYFDTGGYLAQGRALLAALGLPPPAGEAAGAVAGAAGPAAGDGSVVGSRSAVYAGLLALAERAGLLDLVVLLQAALLLVAVWLPVRVAARTHAPRLPVPAVTALAVLAGCLGAAPFYTAYLMPDIFAPVLILAAATLAVLAGSMRAWEILLALALGAAAITMHPSHLVIGALLVPAAALAALLLRPRRGWLGPLLVLAIALAGLAERAAFRVAVETVRQAEVTYLPFLTARLIVDGPGQDWLAANCPGAGLATCELWARLAGEPRRITPSNILFERNPALGSFALMEPAAQRRVAAEQQAFVRAVAAAYPVGVGLAVLRNSAVQLVRAGVFMTLPSGNIPERARTLAGGTLPPALETARLVREPAWLGPLMAVHSGVYIAAGALLAAFVLVPGLRPPAALAGFAAMVLLGLVANAAACGAISQPAERYGARVIFLLPLIAALLLPFRPARAGAAAGA